MHWKKLGRIFCPNNNHPWLKTHAATPVAEHLEGERFKVYFSSRDNKNRAHINYVEFDISHTKKIIKISEKPILAPGEIGAFDDSGTSMGCIVTQDNIRYLYYLGWNLGVTVPWRNSIGLMVSHGNSPFKRFSKAPIFDRNHVDPFTISYPWVSKEGSIWRMWYGSNLKWGEEKKEMDHLLKYAVSYDGIHWKATGEISLNFKNIREYAISRPCVLIEDGTYKMWYTYRGESYRIGYAESKNGIHFTRKDEKVGLNVSKEGWDSEMVCYPFVFDHQGARYMLYNGNGYGRTGFGLAILEQD